MHNTTSVQRSRRIECNRSKLSHIRKSAEQLAEGEECKRKSKLETQNLKRHFTKRKVNQQYKKKNKVGNSVQSRMAVTASRLHLSSHEKKNKNCLQRKVS